MILEVNQATIVVGNNHIVREVGLTTSNGKITGIIGPNGSGKSTLLKACSRLTKPATGSVTLNGEDIWEMYSTKTFAQSVAVLGQERDHVPSVSVEELVETGRTPHWTTFSRPSRVDRSIVQESIKQVGISHKKGARFDQLSGGEKQRALLARALTQHPELLILDEPTNHLDPKAQFDLLDLISSLPITVLMVIHDLTLAARYCDYLYLINNGQIFAEGTPLSVLTSSNIETAFHIQSEWVNSPRLDIETIALAPLERMDD